MLCNASVVHMYVYMLYRPSLVGGSSHHLVTLTMKEDDDVENFLTTWEKKLDDIYITSSLEVHGLFIVIQT